MPFGIGKAKVGQPIGSVSSIDLKKAIGFAMRNNATKFEAFLEAAQLHLDDRHNGDAEESTP